MAGKIHELKFAGARLCDAVYYGSKRHEIRKNDRDYQIGDIIKPIPINGDGELISHPISEMLYKITYVSYKLEVEESPGKVLCVIPPGYVVMTIQPYVCVDGLVKQLMKLGSL